MIKLIVNTYCENCQDFEATTERIFRNNLCDTYVTCENRVRCQLMVDYLSKLKKKDEEDSKIANDKDFHESVRKALVETFAEMDKEDQLLCGDPSPSNDDILTTKKLKDHIVVGRDEYYSFVEHKIF